MTFSQFIALLAFLSAALPLGALALVGLLYGAVAAGRAPVEAAMLFERFAGRSYCWAMIAILVIAFLTIAGWTAKLLLLFLIATFLRGALDLAPWLETQDAIGSTPYVTVAGRSIGWRGVIATASALQWLVLFTVYVKLVL